MALKNQAQNKFGIPRNLYCEGTDYDKDFFSILFAFSIAKSTQNALTVI